MTIKQIVLIVMLGLLFHSVESIGVPSSITIVPLVSHGTAMICAIVFKNGTKSIECSTVSTLGVGETFPLHPTISFDSISGGRHFLCGLRNDGSSFFCWRQNTNGSSNGVNFLSTRVYQNDTIPLKDLVVGESQVAASDRNGTFIQWWFAGRDFPTRFPGDFHSHTSGVDFTCAIDDNNAVVCWGPRGQEIQAVFRDQAMSTVVAGELCACGVATHGRLLCSGRDFGQPSFEFQSLAVGSNDTCVVRSSDMTVVCWGARGNGYTPTKNVSFIFLVANGNIFCGLAEEYNIYCWWSDRSPSRIVELPLKIVVPGVCAEEASCRCGYKSASSKYCFDSGVICRVCTSQPFASHRSSLSEASIEWIVLGCVGFYFIVLFICVC